MTGSSIFDYVHHQDHAEVAEHLGLSLSTGQGSASPSSGISDDGGNNHGTNNPDGKHNIDRNGMWQNGNVGGKKTLRCVT